MNHAIETVSIVGRVGDVVQDANVDKFSADAGRRRGMIVLIDVGLTMGHQLIAYAGDLGMLDGTYDPGSKIMQLEQRIGARLTRDGCFFRVWAPHAETVRIVKRKQSAVVRYSARTVRCARLS